MQKQTAFYVASAAFAATILFTDDKASAASIVVQDGYQLLEKQNTVQTFDLAKEPTTRTINFSLPVDATTVKSNDNIVLFDVTASEKVTIIATVAANKTSVDVKLAEGATYKEGHEYRLLIGSTIKNVATKAESLKQAIQFNYKTINVTAPPVAKPEGEQAASGTLSGTISSITASNVTIGDKSYSMSTPIAAFVAANKEALAGADIKATLTDGNITSIEELTIVKDSAKLVGTDDAGVVKNTTIVIDAERVTLDNIQFANLFIGSTVKQELNIIGATISGKVQTSTERALQNIVEQQPTALLLRFTNTIAAELIITRNDVKVEVTGKSDVARMTVKDNTAIAIDEALVLRQLTIENAVTEVQLNASIAQLDVRSTHNVSLTGKSNIDNVNVKAGINVSLNIQGTLKEAAIQHEDGTITIGENAKINKVKIPTTKQPENVITNYASVKEQLEGKIEKSKLAEFVSAQFVKTDVPQVMNIELTGVSEDANVFYKSYTSGIIPIVGDKLTDANKWTAQTNVPYYANAHYEVFITDKYGIITDSFYVQQNVHTDLVIPSQTTDTLTFLLAADMSNGTVNEYVRGLYITDGTTSEIVDLTKQKVMYDSYGRSYITIDTSNYNGDISYHMASFINQYANLHNIKPDNKNYMKIVYDFAQRMKEGFSNDFYSLLSETNYKIVDYTSATGEKYKQHQSLLSQAPSIRVKYVEAFSEKQYATVADIQQKVAEINEQSKTVVDVFKQYVDQLTNLYRVDSYQYLQDDVTLAQINAIKEKIDAEPLLAANDKTNLLNIYTSALYAYYRSYTMRINELVTVDGLLNEGVTEATIAKLIEEVSNEVDDYYVNKPSMLYSLERLQKEFILQPLKRLENRSWSYSSQRLRDHVTYEQLTAAYEESLALAKTNEQKKRVDNYYKRLPLYYAMRQLAPFTTTGTISSAYDLLPLKEHITEADLEALFQLYEQMEGSAASEINTLKQSALESLPVRHIFNYVSYVNNQYVLKDNVSLEQFLPKLLEAISLPENKSIVSDLNKILNNMMIQTFNKFYGMNGIHKEVTKKQIDEAYEAVATVVTNSSAKSTLTLHYNETLYDYYEAQLNNYYMYPNTKHSTHLLPLKKGTTAADIEAIFATSDDWETASLKEKALASVEVANALSFMKEGYWNFDGEAAVIEGKTKELAAALQTVQKTATNPQAISWIHNTLRTLADAQFTKLANENEYGDGNHLRAEVTLEDIKRAFESAKSFVDDATTKSMYEQYMYYYYAKEASKLLVTPIYDYSTIRLLQEGVTKAQIDAVFATWTFDETNTNYAHKQIQQLKTTMYNALLVYDFMKLFDDNDFDEVTAETIQTAYTKLISDTANNYDVMRAADQLVTSYTDELFRQFYNYNSLNESQSLRKEVTLAHLNAAYDQVKAFNIPEVSNIYQQYISYYYLREFAALTGITKIISEPTRFVEKASVEQIDQLFATAGNTTFAKYAKLSASLQPVLLLLHPNYTNYDIETLFEGVTLEQFTTAYKKAYNEAKDEETKNWLNHLLMNTIMPKSFESLQNSSYTNSSDKLRKDTTLKQIQEIYNTLAPITLEADLATLQAKKYELEYYYYLREVATLTGVKNTINQTTVFAKNVTVEDVNKLFSTWNAEAETVNYYARSITSLEKTVTLAASLQPISKLLHEKYTNSNEPLLAEGATLQQLVTAYKQVQQGTEDELIQQWLNQLVLNTLISKPFNELEKEDYENYSDRLKEDVTLETIQTIYTTLAPIVPTQYASRLENEKYEYEYYYYLREVATLTGLVGSNNTPMPFTKEASLESVKALFKTWNPSTETSSSYARNITNLQNYVTLSAAVQPVVKLLHEEYRYKDYILKEDVTLTQFAEAYKKASSATEDPTVQKWLRDILINTVVSKSFSNLDSDNYNNDINRLKEDVELEHIHAIYNTLLPIIPEADKTNFENKRYAYEYYYYLREGTALTGIARAISQPTVFTKSASLESVEKLFETWDPTVNTSNYYATSITKFAETMKISAAIQPVLSLLDSNYSKYNSKALLSDITIDQFVKTYKETLDKVEHPKAKEWLQTLLSDTFLNNIFINLRNDSYTSDITYLNEDVTVQYIRSISEELAPLLTTTYAKSIKRLQYDYEYYYYMKKIVKLAPDFEKNTSQKYYKLAENVTLDMIEDVFKDFTYVETSHSKMNTIKKSKEILLQSYPLQDLLALTDDLDSNKPFKEGVTIAEIKSVYEAIVAKNDDTLTAHADTLLYLYTDALGETILNSMTLSNNYFGTIKPNVTAAQIDAVIKTYTELGTFFSTEKLVSAVERLTTVKVFTSFNPLLVEDSDGVLKDNTTVTDILTVYNNIKSNAENTSINSQLDSLLNQYILQYYKQQIKTVTGSEYNAYSRYVFANTPTLEQVNAIFNSMAALENHKSLLTTVQTMQKQVLKNYYIQDLLALTQNNSWSRFKADATVEQIQAAYDKAVASENADVLSDVKQLFRSHSNNIVSAIGYTQYNYNTQSYDVELRSYATPEQIQTVYDELTAMQNIVNHEEIAQWIASLTTKLPVREEKVMINATEVVQPTVIKPETLVPAHLDLAEEKLVEVVELLPERIVTDKLEEYNSLQSVKVPVVAETAVSLEQLASYTNVANFITEDDYGFTIGPDVDREQLQMFAEELEAALEGMEGEERLQLLLQLVTDTLAEPVAFVPFSLA